jgi:hypothetical protein
MKQVNLTINISDNKFDQFMDFIKSLDFVSVDTDLDYPSMTEEEIKERVSSSNKQIKVKNTISHNQLVEESKNW